MEPRIREYELLYIIPATYTDEEIGTVEGSVKALLEKNGATILSTSRLGKFRFAYPIKHLRHGQYVLVMFSAESRSLGAIETALRIAPEVLRHLTLSAEEAGGGKFDLVQFTEVNIDAKEDRPRRRRDEPVKESSKADIKSGVAAIEGTKDDVKEPVVEISGAELEKKIESALEEKV
jgi:ribosomal protein S6